MLKHWPASLPHDQDRAEVRLLSFALTFFFAEHLFEPAMYAAFVELSQIHWVLKLTPAPALFTFLLFFWVLLAVPHVLVLLFFPGYLGHRWPRKLACAGASGAALTWFYFALKALPLDVGVLPYLFGVRALLDLMVAAIFAFSLNSQLLRTLINDK